MDLGRRAKPERSDGERWADAEATLDRYPLADADDWRVSARKADRWLAVALPFAAGAVAVWAAGVRADGDPTTGWKAAAVVLTVAGFVVQFAGIRASWLYSRREKPLAVLARRQRRELRDQVRGRVPLRSEHLRLVRWQAEQQALATATLVQSLGCLVWLLAQGAIDDDVWLRVLRGACVLVMLGAGGCTLLVTRRARRFLSGLPQPATA
ncbi:hypothetical protein [Modestobacter sp. NPDC049651]|uniref:hypothetical protein n=1 Tax=unclassified Modestobacter TaxID=2643866 RepID=UPI0033DF3FFD